MKKKLNCILLIDDDEPTTFLSEMLIEESDCALHVQVAQSGKAALNYLTSSDNFAMENKLFPRPDLILLDINMPAMNGWEFIKKYNDLENGHKGKIVMVMLSTSINAEDKLRAEEMPGISGFESKPLTPQKLNKILGNYFQDYL